jgi:hypothetical protein
LASGLLLGAALKPNLADDQFIGPQIFLGWSAARAAPPSGEAAEYATYSGRVPDYVYGTDWVRPMEVADAGSRRADVAPPREAAADPAGEPDAPAPVVVTPDEDAARMAEAPGQTG